MLPVFAQAKLLVQAKPSPTLPVRRPALIFKGKCSKSLPRPHVSVCICVYVCVCVRKGEKGETFIGWNDMFGSSIL